VNADGSRLYVANAISDSVAVIDTGKLTAKAAKQGMVEPMGFVPTEWMPMSMAFVSGPAGGRLYVCNRQAARNRAQQLSPAADGGDGQTGISTGLPRILRRCSMGHWPR